MSVSDLAIAGALLGVINFLVNAAILVWIYGEWRNGRRNQKGL